MGTRTPVIANKSGGHTEIINDKFNGWLCDINNMTDTTNLVLKIIKNINDNSIIAGFPAQEIDSHHISVV